MKEGRIKERRKKNTKRVSKKKYKVNVSLVVQPPERDSN